MSMNRRYIASLAVAAVAILAVGLFVKHELRVQPTPVASLSEAAAMQQLSHEGQVRRLSSYLEERIAAVGRFVEYVPTSRASGLRWRAGDTLVTTFADRPIATLLRSGADTMRVPPLATSDSLRGQWAIIAARTSDGSLISAAGIVGGRATSTCGAIRDVAEYLVGVPIPDAFAGAGVFDLDGRLRGIVARCASRLAVLPASTVMRLLPDRDSLGADTRRWFGAVLQPVDSTTRDHVSADSGLLVTEVLRASPADRAGWQPGDVISQINGIAVGGAVTSAMIDSVAPSDTATVVLLRAGRRVTTRLAPTAGDGLAAAATSSLGIGVTRPANAGVPIERVDIGSVAYAAGLRPGDVLLRVDNTVVTTPAEAQRALDRIAPAGRAAFLVFVRDSVRRGALVRP
jgi:serine protease Do